jgi:hypothetical protein
MRTTMTRGVAVTLSTQRAFRRGLLGLSLVGLLTATACAGAVGSDSAGTVQRSEANGLSKRVPQIAPIRMPLQVPQWTPTLPHKTAVESATPAAANPAAAGDPAAHWNC